MKVEIIKINASIKFSNKFFIDVELDNSIKVCGIHIIIKKNLPIVTLPQLIKENGKPYSPFLFTSKELALNFRNKIREEFLKHAAAGTLRPDPGPQDNLPRAMDKPFKSRNVFSKKRVPFKRGPEKKYYRPKTKTIGNV